MNFDHNHLLIEQIINIWIERQSNLIFLRDLLWLLSWILFYVLIFIYPILLATKKYYALKIKIINIHFPQSSFKSLLMQAHMVDGSRRQGWWCHQRSVKKYYIFVFIMFRKFLTLYLFAGANWPWDMKMCLASLMATKISDGFSWNWIFRWKSSPILIKSWKALGYTFSGSPIPVPIT